MYCSKLTYWVYHDWNSRVDLNSGRTQTVIDGIKKEPLSIFKLASWVGCTPDDIWASKCVTPDHHDLVGPENLKYQWL